MGMEKPTNESLEGKLHFHSETSTKGGFWAFQDSRHISETTTRYTCSTCHIYWDESVDPDIPLTFEKEGLCPPTKHTPILASRENWSYDGLHILRDGDQLTIYHPENLGQTVWSGIIALKQHPLFTEPARGYWIHADQIGIERDTWAEYFFKRYRATLIPSKNET